MEPGAIFLLLVVSVIVVLFIIQPFAVRWRVKVQSSREISSLMAERERTLTALQDLDSDFTLGKVPDSEYAEQRSNFIQRGSDVLRKLDELQAAQATVVEKTLVVQEPVITLSDDDLEDLVARRRSSNPKKPAGFCPKCGKPILQSDHFCPSCGQVLIMQDPVSSK